MKELTTKGNLITIPNEIVEAKINITAIQMDIVSMLLSEIHKEPSKCDTKREYIITVKDYAGVKGISEDGAYTLLKNKVFNLQDGLQLLHMDLYIGNEFIHYNWFSKVRYDKGRMTFKLTDDIKQFLVEFKRTDRRGTFTKLKYLLLLKSTYSKHLYLMCREFITSGVRYVDNDWEIFREKLGIPISYSNSMIKKRVLETAKKEINELTDITIDYNITTETVSGGNGNPINITFYIYKKDNTVDETIPNTDIVQELKDKNKEKDKEIENQAKEIEELKKQLMLLQNKQ